MQWKRHEHISVKELTRTANPEHSVTEVCECGAIRVILFVGGNSPAKWTGGTKKYDVGDEEIESRVKRKQEASRKRLGIQRVIS